MGARSEEMNVDGKFYLSTLYTASKGVKLLTRLTKVVGRPLSALVSDGKVDANTDTENLNMNLIAAAVSALGDSIDEDSVVVLIKDILDTTQYKTDEGTITGIQFDSHFAGSYKHLFNLLKAVLTFQYSDFLAESPSAREPVRAQGGRR